MKRTAIARSSVPLKRVPIAKKRGTPRKKVKRAKTASQLRKEATTLWGKVIHARDVYCQVCGGADGKLDAHHILRREFNATRADENNGMLVHAYPCHQTILHGDPFRAVQIYSERLGVDGYAALRQKAYDGQNQRFGVDYWRNEQTRLRALLEALDG